MSQKTNPILSRLNNRRSWLTINSSDNRQFNNLFFTNLQIRYFISVVSKFFSILSDKPLIKTYKFNSVFLRSNFTTIMLMGWPRALKKRIFSFNSRVSSYKKVRENHLNFAHFFGLTRFVLYDSVLRNLQKNRKQNASKKRKTSVLSKKIVKSTDFSLVRSNSAQIIANYIGWQIQASLKQRDWNFQSNFKKGINKTIQSFLKRNVDQTVKSILSMKSKNPICGVKVICAGRWKKTKSGRKQKFTLYKGKLAMQSYSSFLDFGFYHGNTKFGSFSFKVLVAYNQ